MKVLGFLPGQFRLPLGLLLLGLVYVFVASILWSIEFPKTLTNLSKVQLLQLGIGANWSALLLIPVTVVSAIFGVRLAPFLALIILCEIAALVIWYRISNMWSADVAGGEMGTVVFFMFINAFVQVPLWWLTCRTAASFRTSRASSAP